MSLFAELKRRKVFRVGFAYAVGGWLFVQVADIAADNFAAPDWVMRILIILVLAGLPVALFLTWAFELTPDGVKKADDISAIESNRTHSGRTVKRTTLAMLALVVVVMDWVQLSSDSPIETASSPAGKSSISEAIESISVELSTQMLDEGARNISVLEFTDINGYESTLGKFVAEELMTNFVIDGNFHVVESREYDRILQEHAMYADGLFDPKTIPELQKLVGVDSLVTGTVTTLGNHFSLSVRAISVETARY